MSLRFITVLFLSIFLISSSAEASSADKAYQSAKKSYAQISKSKKLKHSTSNWRKVIKNFESFAEKHPRDARVDGALLTIGELYEKVYEISKKTEDINSSIEAYRTLAKKYPRSPLADDAVFKTGEIYLHKENREAAYIEFNKVLRKYPKGNMAAKASVRVKELSKETVEEEKPKAVETTETQNKVHISDMKYWSNPNYTRIVIYADSKVSFKETFLKGKDDSSPRLFLDISGSKLKKELIQQIAINDGLLKSARAGQFDLNTVRVVLDIDSIDSYKIFALEDPYRIVVDVSGEKHEAQAADQIEHVITKTDPNIPAVTAPPVEKEIKEPVVKPSLAQQLGLGIRKVVVDPGHGGHDCGAIGYGGIREKDVVLDVGKKLRKILTERLGLEVVMTRDTDIFIPLEERTAIANKAGADLFISVHANSSRNKKAKGVETYFLNFATDEASMRLAARENATTTKNIGDLQAILNDLMLNSKINESSKLARFVQGSILDEVNGNGSRSKDRGVRQAPFYVLIGAQMPSILVETSFISNKEEAKKLSDDKFKMTIAESIADGVKKYSEIIKVARR